MATKQPRKGKPVVQYYLNGHAVNQSGNKLSSIAWFNTADIKPRPTASSPNAPRCLSSGDLQSLIIKLVGKGSDFDPRTEAFDVTLPNGNRIHMKVGRLVAPTPVPRGAVKKTAAKKTTAAKTTAAKKGTTSAKSTASKTAKKSAPATPRASSPKAPRVTKAQRAELAQDARREDTLVKAWREGGEVGPRPETPATEKLKALPPSRGAQKVANQGGGVKPTNKDRKVPKARGKAKSAEPKAETPVDPRDDGGADEKPDSTPAEGDAPAAEVQPEPELVSV